MHKDQMENDIKYFFDQRTITPAPHSWERIESMLTEKKPSKVFRIKYYYVAAAALVIFFMTIWAILHHSEIDQAMPDKIVVMGDGQKNHDAKDLSGNSDISDSKKVSETQINHGKGLDNSPLPKHRPSKSNPLLQSDLVLVKYKDDPSVNHGAENALPDDDLHHYTEGSSGNHSTYYANAEYLLQEAERAGKIINSPITKPVAPFKYGVDPSKLLLEAENAAQKTFSAKVFKTIAEKSEILVATVTNRND